MKRRFIKKAIVPVILAVCFVPVAASGCNSTTFPEGEIIDGGKYTLNLDTAGYSVAVNVESALPHPQALDEKGNDISDLIEVEVFYEDGSVYVPAHPIDMYDGFLPAMEGKYSVHYRIKDGNTVRHEQSIELVAVKSSRKDNVEIDGVLDDGVWQCNPVYTTGIGGNMSVNYYFAQDGLYMGVDVKDEKLCYSNYMVSRLTQSDGFEIYLDLASMPDDILNDKCYKIAVSLCGEVAVYGTSTGYTLYERLERVAPEYKLQIHGTRSLVGGGESLSVSDKDEGYTFEMFLPFDQLGIENVPESVGIAFAHRDVTTVESGAAADGKAGNTRYTSVVLPADIKQILMNNGLDYYVDKYDNFALTRMYHKLRVVGDNKGISVPQVGGLKDKDSAFFSGGTAVQIGGASAKFIKNTDGLYALINVTDNSVTSSVNSDIYGGDCVQIRIAAGDTLASTALPKGFATKDRIVTLSPSGMTVQSYLNSSKQLFGGGFDMEYKIEKKPDGYTVKLFIPAYELGEGDFGVCVGVLDKNNAAATTEKDMIYSVNANDPTKYTKIGG